MKGIKKTLMAGVLACAAFNVHAEVDKPWSFGIKGAIGGSSPVRYSDGVTISGKKANSSFFSDLACGGDLYAEYAITDIFGVGIEAGYMKLGATLTEEKGKQEEGGANNANNAISMLSHNISSGLHVYFYPLSRGEAGEGILKITLGACPYFVLKSTYKEGETEISLTDSQKKEQQKVHFAVVGGLAYEFPFGLFLEGRYGHGITNGFNTEGDKEQTIFSNVTGLKKLYMQHTTFHVGYNIASLLS